MRNNQFLNQAAVTVISDGSPDVDFMSGDSVRVLPNTEGSSIEVGFDSSVTVFSTDQSGTVELDFKATSPSLDKYERLWMLQKTSLARLFNVQIMTSATQMIRCEGCSIGSVGSRGTGGKTASANTIVLNVQKIIY